MKYMDFNNFKNYFNKIENFAQKNDEFSFKVLFNDFDKNIIYNDNIFKFKNYIKKCLYKMEIYYENDLLFQTDQLNMKCLNAFYELIKNEINRLTLEKDYKYYYLYIKKKLYRKLKLIYDSYKKSLEKIINEKQIVVLNKFIKNIMYEYSTKVNVLKKYNVLNKELTSYDDLLYINLYNTDDINSVLYEIDKNNKTYNKILLPNKLIIKETNKNINFQSKHYINDNIVDFKNTINIIINKNGKIQKILINCKKNIKYYNIIIDYIKNYNILKLFIHLIKKGIR